MLARSPLEVFAILGVVTVLHAAGIVIGALCRCSVLAKRLQVLLGAVLLCVTTLLPILYGVPCVLLFNLWKPPRALILRTAASYTLGLVAILAMWCALPSPVDPGGDGSTPSHLTLVGPSPMSDIVGALVGCSIVLRIVTLAHPPSTWLTDCSACIRLPWLMAASHFLSATVLAPRRSYIYMGAACAAGAACSRARCKIEGDAQAFLRGPGVPLAAAWAAALAVALDSYALSVYQWASLSLAWAAGLGIWALYAHRYPWVGRARARSFAHWVPLL